MKLTCKSHGFPLPIVQWYKDGLELIDFRNVLSIQHLSKTDTGSYQCRSRNNVSEKSTTKYVTVYCKLILRLHES